MQYDIQCVKCLHDVGLHVSRIRVGASMITAVSTAFAVTTNGILMTGKFKKGCLVNFEFFFDGAVVRKRINLGTRAAINLLFFVSRF